MSANDRLTKIIQALEAKDAKRPCARCGGLNFQIVGESTLEISDLRQSTPLRDIGKYQPAPKPQNFIPVVHVACPKCGYIWQHALTKLDIEVG